MKCADLSSFYFILLTFIFYFINSFMMNLQQLYERILYYIILYFASIFNSQYPFLLILYEINYNVIYIL